MPLKKLEMFLNLIILFLAIIYCSAADDSGFGRHQEGILAAFGDFNSDELTDAFIIRKKSSLEVYLAYEKEPLFRPSVYACNFSSINIIITSVVPGDFDGDAYMDILITTQDVNDTSNLHNVRILWGGKPSINCTDALLVKAVTIGQPMVIDYDRDMTLDLFGENAKQKRVYWIFNQQRLPPKEISVGKGKLEALKLPHSHSYLDVNNDNAADLLVTTKLHVEVWLNQKPEGFKYNSSINLLLGHSVIFGQAVFLDMTLSGQFFLLLPVCNDVNCLSSTLQIYNNSGWQELQLDLVDLTGTLWRFVPPRDDLYLDTITMRTGDYNMDGYPDLLMTLSPVNSNITRVFLLHNVPCNWPSCKFKRTFAVQWEKFNSFGNDVVMATFYDLYMDGVLDILYVKKNKTSGTYEMNAFRNKLEYDTNFIKVIVVTGLKNEIIPIINRTIYSRKITFGTNLPGPKISYNTWSQEGNYRTGVCAQLYQSAHFSLQLPYSIFGLDVTPNFVDTLTVGLYGNSKSWTQIIPNSQIVVIPAPPYDSSQWKAQLFVTPSKVILKSLFVIVAILFVILCLVIYLHWKEKKYSHGDFSEIENSMHQNLIGV